MLLSMNNTMGNVNILKSNDSVADYYPCKDYYALTKKGAESNYKIITNLDDKIIAPKTKGDVVGKALVTKDGVIIEEIDLVLHEDVHSLTFKESFNKIIKKF